MNIDIVRVLQTLEIKPNTEVRVCSLCKHYGKLKVDYPAFNYGVGECAILAKEFWYPIRERAATYACAGCCLWEKKG
jgi:hypothetical protein